MISVTGIRTVALYVANPATARRFYEDLLHLPVVAEHHGRVQLDAGGVRLLLHPTDTDTDDRAQARHGRTEVYFEVRDVDAAVLELRSAGVEIVQEPTDQPWGERDAMVLDPDGFPVLLTEPRP